jgi:HSP20 family protein
MAEAKEKKNQTQFSEMGPGWGSGLARRGSFMPSLFSLGPGGVFSLSPFELMRRFTDEMDRAFEDFGLARGARETGIWSPPVEVFERDNNLVVRAELPGLSENDVKIELTDDGLIIQGERKSEHEERREGFYRSEISYGNFYRMIPLPEEADVDQAQAQMNNGVLEVVIPMAEARRRRRSIPIRTSGQAAQAAGGQAQTATGGSGKQ